MNSIQIEDIPFETRRELVPYISELRELFHPVVKEKKPSDELFEKIDRYYAEKRIPEKWLTPVKDEAFFQAVHFEAVASRSAARTGSSALFHLAIRLGLSSNFLSRMKQEASTLAILNRILESRYNELPAIDAESTILKPGETAFAEFRAMIIDSDAVNQDHVNGEAETSSRIARGIPFRIGETKTNLVSGEDVPPTDTGFLILTNKRIIFSGTKSSLSFEIERLFGTRIFADALQFSTMADQTIITVGFDAALAAEYCGVILSKGLNS